MPVLTPSPECELCGKFLTRDEEISSLAALNLSLCEGCLETLESARKKPANFADAVIGTCYKCEKTLTAEDRQEGLLVECHDCYHKN